MTVIAAVDPGLRGGLCALRCEAGKAALLSVVDMPLAPDKTKTQVDVDRVCQWVERFRPELAVIENVSPMGGSGAKSVVIAGASAFRFGIAVGQIRAVFQCYRIPVILVVPRIWKPTFNLSGKDKEASRQAALRLLPEAAPHLTRKLDHGRAESILLGLYQAERRGFL